MLGLIGAVSKQANLIFTKLRDNQRHITYTQKSRIRRTPNLNYRLNISICNLTSTWHFHQYATPWQLSYNRDEENLFHFTCSWKISGQKHKLKDSSEQKKENKPRPSRNRNFLLWLEKGKKNFFVGYPRARQAIASYLSKHKLFEIFKSYSWSCNEMLIDWVKSYIILIYTYEVTAFPGLEIFVKHRILYDSLHFSVGPAKFSQLQCFSSKMTVFSRAWGLCRKINNSFFLIPRLSTYRLLQVRRDSRPDM